MLALLWRFLLFISVIWFIQRVLGFLFGSPRKEPRPEPKAANGSTANRMVRDPVCGMYLDPRLAVSFKNKSETVYFCSEECRRKFTANPV
jgi:YHS domain-containing protein